MTYITKQLTAQAAVGPDDVPSFSVNLESQVFTEATQDRVEPAAEAMQAAIDAYAASLLAVHPTYNNLSTAVTFAMIPIAAGEPVDPPVQ